MPIVDAITERKRMDALANELVARKREGFALYRPRQEQEAFHRSVAMERVVRGGVRSGKTTCAVGDVASACLRQPIKLWSGETIPLGYPSDRPLTLWLIGYDQRHIARMYRKLFEPGLYKVVRDKATKEWRAWKPWEPDDAKREKETRRSEPLIPARMIETIAWENKAESVPSVVTLKNGTKLFFFPSGGEAGVGDAVDLIWIDEDVQIPSHVQEWQSRLADNRGRLIWSSWPKGSNMALRLMVKRAEESAGEPRPDIECWTLRFSDNPYIPEDSKRKLLKAWAAAGEGNIIARDLGLFADGLQLVFPKFDIDKHGIPSKGDPDPVELSLRSHAKLMPTDWTYYLALDPGHANIAAVVAMVPPARLGDAVVIRRSFYWSKQDADAVAADIAKEFGHIPFQAFIIDGHAGRVHTIGRSERVVDLYSAAFERAKLESVTTGHGFIYGSDDVAARNMLVRTWLGDDEHGVPRFRLVTDATYSMQNEFGLYKGRVTKTEGEKDAVVDSNNHAMDCNGYLMAYLNPLFQAKQAWAPSPPEAFKDPMVAFMNEFTRPKANDGKSFWLGPGVPPTVGAA